MVTMLRPRMQMVGHRLKMADTNPQATQRIRGRALQTIRDRILRRDNGLCRCDVCQSTGALKAAHEAEHRIPLWAGGEEDDSNRYAINTTCHKAKTACEAAMRARGTFDPTQCTCGRHRSG